MNVELVKGDVVTNPSKIIDLYVDSDGVAKEVIEAQIYKSSNTELIITSHKLSRSLDKYTQHFHLENGKFTKVLYSPLDCTNCIEARRNFTDINNKRLPSSGLKLMK